MQVYRPYRATANEFRQFHSDDYVTFLQRINLNNMNNDIKSLMKRFDIGTHSRLDCPVFEGWSFLINLEFLYNSAIFSFQECSRSHKSAQAVQSALLLKSIEAKLISASTLLADFIMRKNRKLQAFVTSTILFSAFSSF